MLENQRKLVKTFTVLFGFIVAPAVAVGYAFLLGWPNWALLTVMVSVGLIQLWAYRKRTLLGRSQRRLVFTTVIIIASLLLSTTLGWWSALLTIVLAIVWYSQYQMWHNKKTDPWENIDLEELPKPKIPRRLKNRITSEKTKSVERQAWIALLLKPPSKDDVVALVVMSAGLLLAGLFAGFVLNTPAEITGAITAVCVLLWLVVWWLTIYAYTYIVCTEEGIMFFEATPWGSEIRPVLFENILVRRVDPKYFARLMGYTSINLNTAATDGDDDVNKALRYVKYPGTTWFILRR